MTEDDFTPGAPQPPVHTIERIAEGVPEGVALIALAGELDLSSAGDFRSVLDAALAEGVERVVIDLGEVAFVDSSMLKELLRANAEISEQRRKLVLVAPQPAVQRLLDLTRTTEMFTLVDDRAAGLA